MAGGAEVVVVLVVVSTRQKPPPDESMLALYKSAKSAFEQQLHLSTARTIDNIIINKTIYRIVVSRSTSQLVTPHVTN